MHRFDYYRATVPAHVELVLERLEAGLAAQGVGVTRDRAKGRWNFEANTLLRDELGAVVVEVLHGGNPHPCVEVSGVWSPVVADILREHEHRPSRVDVCCDMAASGLFGRFGEFTRGAAPVWGIRRACVVNDSPDLGDTIYLGSRKSQVFVRIYQPGLKRAAEEGRTGDAITQAERDAVRVELEFKPEKPRGKVAAAGVEPAAMWGLSPWTAELATAFWAMDAKPISISERRESNHDRALRFMATQYRAHLEWLEEACEGDSAACWAAVCAYGGFGPENAS